MSEQRASYSQRAALALRFHFLFEALHLDLLPSALAGAVQHLSDVLSDRAVVLPSARTVESAFLDHRENLELADLGWPRVTERSLIQAAQTARRRAEGDAVPRLAAERLARFCEDLATGGRKRRLSGSYYTPPWAADAIAQTVVRGVLAGRGGGPDAALSLRAIDPAVGAGAFAIALVEAIATAAGEGEERNAIRRQAVEGCIYAVEKNPLAAEACRLGLWLAASRPGHRASLPVDHIHVGDALVEPPERGSFDLVVGNPPWGVKLPPARASKLAKTNPQALSGHRDSALFFLHLAAEAAADDGALGLLLPDALLWHVRCEGMRQALLARFRPLRVALLGDRIFPGTTAPSCILCLAGSGIAPPTFSTTDLRRVPRAGLRAAVARQGWRVPRNNPLEAAHHSFFAGPSWLRRLQQLMLARHTTLGHLDEVFALRDVGINYARADLGRAILYDGERQDTRDIPVTRGRDFGPLTPIGHSAWLRRDWPTRIRSDDRVSVRSEIYRRAPKLLLRQTGDRPVATIDRRGVTFGRSVIAITAESERDLLWLAALLNSTAFAALYRAVAPEAGRPFAQVKVTKLKAVPVPPVGEGGLAELAARMLSERDEESRRELLAAIDRAAARAYGLSESDVEHVVQWI